MLKGLKLTWYNLMSYKYRDIILKNGNVILGHYYFDMAEDIIIPEYEIKLNNPGNDGNFPQKCFEEARFPQEYFDGHLIISFFDIKKNRPAIIANKKDVDDIKRQMEIERPDIEEFINKNKEDFRQLTDDDDQKDAVGIDLDTLFIPAVDPRDDYKESADRTIEMINKANQPGNMFGNFKIEPLHLILLAGGALIVSKYMGMW
jgi:hypothetical protein